MVVTIVFGCKDSLILAYYHMELISVTLNWEMLGFSLAVPVVVMKYMHQYNRKDENILAFSKISAK